MSYTALFVPNAESGACLDRALLGHLQRTTTCVKRQLPNHLLSELQDYGLTGHQLSIWRPEFGCLKECLNRSGQTTNAAAQYLLCVTDSSLEFEISVDTYPNQLLVFEGYRIKTGDKLCVRSSKNVVSLLTETRAWSFVVSEGGGLRNEEIDSAVPREIFENHLTLSGLDSDPALTAPIDTPLSPASFKEACQLVREAFRLLRTDAPQYYQWCKGVLAQIHLVGCRVNEASISRSALSRPGSVVLSHPSSIVQFVESLVHESTHQYFHIVAALIPLLRTVENRLFYSSIVERDRPIERLLFAYHASANILLALNMVRDRRGDLRKAIDIRLAEHRQVCRQLLDVLTAERALFTEAADEFWWPSSRTVEEFL